MTSRESLKYFGFDIRIVSARYLRRLRAKLVTELPGTDTQRDAALQALDDAIEAHPDNQSDSVEK